MHMMKELLCPLRKNKEYLHITVYIYIRWCMDILYNEVVRGSMFEGGPACVRVVWPPLLSPRNMQGQTPVVCCWGCTIYTSYYQVDCSSSSMQNGCSAWCMSGRRNQLDWLIGGWIRVQYRRFAIMRSIHSFVRSSPNNPNIRCFSVECVRFK